MKTKLYSDDTLRIASNNARKLRRAYGYTQEFVDKVLGTKTGSYWNFEGGNGWMYMDHILKLCNLYNVTFDTLCNENLTVTANIHYDVVLQCTGRNVVVGV